MNVGYVHRGYNEARNILSNSSREFKYIKTTDIYKLRDYFNFKLTNTTNHYFHNSFDSSLSFPKVDLYHFFNGINYGNSSWVSTFEALLPRYGSDYKKIVKGINALAKNNCKQLIAFSKFNMKFQQNYLESNFPEFYQEISSKITLIYPPQVIPDKIDFDRFLNPQIIKLLFVGHDFFRKGGRETFNVVESLYRLGLNINLTIVSRLETDSFISNTNNSDKLFWLEKINSAAFCKYYPTLKNVEVNKLMQTSHILLIPSFQETFGYVVLEAQANALPVITTSIRAFPEINNSDCGWLIDVPQTKKGFSDIYLNGYEYISEIIEHKLKQIIEEVLNNPSLLSNKSKKSYERVKKDHDIVSFSEKIKKVYENALFD